MESFNVVILGCGSALPTMKHQASAQLVEVRDKLFLIDCAEGTQQQLRKAKVRFGKLGHVFISHIHGDHCFGLIGLISTFGLLGRTAPLHVFAPIGLKPVLDMQLQVFCQHLEYEVVFHAVDTTKENVVYEDRSLTVTAVPLAHRMPCCGYVFREKPLLPHIRRDMIDMYGIPVSEINNIKNGKDWVMDDGEVIANSKLVTPANPPRAYAYCSDTAYMPLLHESLRGVTTLYHESTYSTEYENMADKYMHSTAKQAAMVARDAGVGTLVLGHYSSRIECEEKLLDQAKEVFANTILSNEMMKIQV